MKEQTILDFVRFCIDDAAVDFHPQEEVDWERLYDFAVKQALVGVMFHGVERMTGEQKPPKTLLMKWLMAAEQVKAYNRKVNAKAVEVAKLFHDDGFQCCILKGQGNALMYPNPMLRMPGDIDIWMKPEGMSMAKDMDAIRQRIKAYVKERYTIEYAHYYHVEFHVGEVPVEAHYMPGIMNNFRYNRRLQQYYAAAQDEQCNHWVDLPDGVGRIPVPTVEFNIIFQLCHLMHHFFDEGIGLRQMMDYYYLLRTAKMQTDVRQEEWGRTLKHLNLYRFAGAVMYVMQVVFDMPHDYMIAPVDVQRGKTLMYEILKGGNFGQHSGLTKHGTGVKYLLKNWRSLQLMREYPAEALSEPLFRTYHFFWRLINNDKDK